MSFPHTRRGRSRISTVGMTRRDTVKSMLFAGGALVFSGFGRPTQAVAQDKTRLVQWYHQYGEAGTEDAVRRYAAAYTEENPDVEIEVNWQLGDYGAALSAALLTDEGPDVFEQGVPTLDQVRQGQVTPLDDLYTEDVKSDFNPTNLKGATIDGSIYSVKMVDDCGTFYYRKSSFEDAGLEPPTTLDGLIEAAAALTSGRQKGLYLGQDGGISAAAGPVVWSAGAEYLNEDNTAPAFNTEAVQASITKFRDLFNSDSLLQGATTDWWDPSSFTQSLCHMQWGGLWAMPQINAEVGDDYGVFPWPASSEDGVPSTFWGGWGECVNGKSQNIDAAKAFVKWLWIDNTEFQTDWNLSYGFHVPPRQSVAEAAEPLKEGNAAEVVSFLNDYGHPGRPLWTGAMGTAYTDALTRILRDGEDAASELAAAEQTVQEELDRLLGEG